MAGFKVSRLSADSADQADLDRAQLVALGRQGGMSDAAIARALRAGSVVVSVSNGKHKGTAPRPNGVEPAAPAQYDAIATAYLDELARAGWPTTTLDDLRSPSKKRRFTWPRQVLMRLLRDTLGEAASYPDISAFLGKADHTTAMHACAHSDSIMAREPMFKRVSIAAKLRVEASP